MTPQRRHNRTPNRKSILVLSTLALLAGCSSAPPTEDASSSSAAVITSMPFQEIPGATGSDVGSDSLGINWVAKATPTAPNGQEYSWSIGTPFAGTPVGGQSGIAVDVGAQGPWVINAALNIYGWMNGGYQQIPGSATDVGVSTDGNTVYVVGVGASLPGLPGGHPIPAPLDYPIYKWVSNSFVPITGVYGLRVDASNDGSAYVVDHTGAVRHITGGPVNAVSTYVGPNGTNATDVTVGADGTVFVVGNNGVGVNAPIYVYDPTANNWDALPGALGVRVSASSATVVTVVNSAGTIWTTGVSTCGGVLENPCPGDVCGSKMNPDPTLGGTCGYCGAPGQPCCGTACYGAANFCSSGQYCVYSLDVHNVTTRYNDVVFQVTSSSPVSWGWKVTSGNLQAEGVLPPGGGPVDLAENFIGPPYYVYPNTLYSVTFYPGGLSSPAQATIPFLTPSDTTPQCEIDHDCGGDPGSGGDGSSQGECDPGFDCCPGSLCGAGDDGCGKNDTCF